ncbi:MAG TPA: MFS transporter [Trebonia sp.]|nr:MFS transporter [Trebonia sp.]
MSPVKLNHVLAGEAIPQESRQLMARLDRLRTWSLSPSFLVIIGLGFLFTFYDIFDINVSFVQTCTQLVRGCTPATALSRLPMPTALNLMGYVIGTLILSPVCDRIGRKNMLLITMLITGLGSLYSALSPDYVNFTISRVLTGVGIGADLAIVNTYISEVSPLRSRAKFTTVVFINSALGAVAGIWLGLLLTTARAPWPAGLPFAAASTTFTDGWRWMYGIGAILALVAIALRSELQESPRWLIQRGRVAAAARVIEQMEARDLRAGPLPEPLTGHVPTHWPQASRRPFSDLLANPLYLRRAILLFWLWFAGYITVYAFAAGFTSVLASLRYSPPEAGVITAIGTLGFVAEAAVMSFLVEKLERRYWLPIAAAVTLTGAFILAAAAGQAGVAFAGAILIFVGFNLWVTPTYALTAESFPTRARSTGFGLVDGTGHIGGGIGILVLAPLIPHLSVFWALLLISCFLVVAAILAQFTTHTRGRVLERLSP